MDCILASGESGKQESNSNLLFQSHSYNENTVNAIIGFHSFRNNLQTKSEWYDIV